MLRTGRESAGVLNRLKRGVRRIRVRLRRSVLRITNGEDDIDVGQTARENPEPLTEAARVDHLDHRFDIGGAEEREVAGVACEAHRLTGAVVSVVRTPCRSDRETIVVQTDRGRVLRAS